MNFNVTTTIANGASESSAIDLDGHWLGAVSLPAAWTAADLTVLASPDGGSTWLPVYDAAGNEVTIQADTERWVAVTRESTEAYRRIKLRSGNAATPVNQGAARTIHLAIVGG